MSFLFPRMEEEEETVFLSRLFCDNDDGGITYNSIRVGETLFSAANKSGGCHDEADKVDRESNHC